MGDPSKLRIQVLWWSKLSRIPVTSSIITSLVWNLYKPSFATGILGGVDPTHSPTKRSPEENKQNNKKVGREVVKLKTASENEKKKTSEPNREVFRFK